MLNRLKIFVVPYIVLLLLLLLNKLFYKHFIVFSHHTLNLAIRNKIYIWISKLLINGVEIVIFPRIMNTKRSLDRENMIIKINSRFYFAIFFNFFIHFLFIQFWFFTFPIDKFRSFIFFYHTPVQMSFIIAVKYL